jgi:hypothetical protein
MNTPTLPLDITKPTHSLRWPDRIGTWASVACLIHCIATPIVLSLSVVAAHFLPTEEHTHRSLAVGIALVGMIALIRGLRQHRRQLIGWLMFAGMFCIAAAALRGDSFPHHWMEVAVTFCGSAFMIVAHRLNHTFCAQCSCSSRHSESVLN